MPMCVNCFKNATEGNLRLPYCKECFKKKFGTGIHAFVRFEIYEKIVNRG